MLRIKKLGVVAVSTTMLTISGLAGSAAGAAPTVAAAAPRTNLILLAGVDFDFPVFFSTSTRALSASPVFAITGDALRLDVSRSGGTVRVRQDGVELPVHPRSVLQGLPDFFRWRLLRADGTVVASAQVDVCPQPGTLFSATAWGFSQPVNLDPANPTTPAEFPFALECGDPLSMRAQWGFASGWAAQLHVAVPNEVEPGSYTLEASINADGGLRESDRSDDRVRMPVEVIDIGGPFLTARATAARQAMADRTGSTRELGLPVRPMTAATGTGTVGTTAALADGASVDLPDLVPLPSENIATRTEGASDLLRFNSTMANLGRGRLQVDGFRAGAAEPDQMLAYQVLFHNGVPVGRRPAGTLEFEADEFEWHFDFLARYQLLDADGVAVATSGKIGFCMANVHQLDAANPGFVIPDFLGFIGCGGALSQSVREWIDPGWGDEYDQITPEQELDITGVPNGTYRIRILADPDHKLLESTRSNNESLRTIVLGGVPGARTVTVPPIDGVDTEAAWASVHLPF